MKTDKPVQKTAGIIGVFILMLAIEILLAVGISHLCASTEGPSAICQIGGTRG